jgi:hypothetical protein
MFLQKIERREKIEQIVRERERQRMEVYQRKWSRREEADFFRTISTFGVEFDRWVICVMYNLLLSYTYCTYILIHVENLCIVLCFL